MTIPTNEARELIERTFDEYTRFLQRNLRLTRDRRTPFTLTSLLWDLGDWQNTARADIRNYLFRGLSADGYNYLLRQCSELADIYRLSTRGRLAGANVENQETSGIEPMSIQLAINYLRGMANDFANIWEHPVFIFGVSASATGPMLSIGTSAGIYFVPNEKNDSRFYASLTALFIPTNPVLRIAHLRRLMSRSKDYGFFTDVATGGTGWAFEFFRGKPGSASVGVTVGIIRSLDDLTGVSNQTGGSLPVKAASLSGGLIFNQYNLDERSIAPVGGTITVGLGLGSRWDAYSRVGNTFVYSVKERRWLNRN